MTYFLDTNSSCTASRNGLASYFPGKKKKPNDIALSSITVAELEFGVENSAFPEKNRMALLEKHAGGVPFTLHRVETPLPLR